VLHVWRGYVQGSKGQPSPQEASGEARVEEAMYLIRNVYEYSQWSYTIGTWEPDGTWNEIRKYVHFKDAMELAASLNATLKGYSE